MFHFQVLKNAQELEGMNPEAFCKEINVPISYRTEFTKMIELARLMREQGLASSAATPERKAYNAGILAQA